MQAYPALTALRAIGILERARRHLNAQFTIRLSPTEQQSNIDARQVLCNLKARVERGWRA